MRSEDSEKIVFMTLIAKRERREELLAALKEPEKHTHLMVRVGGYSARFVDLTLALQEEIIARTEY